MKSATKEYALVLKHVLGITLVGLCAFILGYAVIPEEWGIESVRYLTKPLFYGVLLVVAAWSFGALRQVRLSAWLCAAALCGCLLLIAQHSYSYRVLFDEYVIAAQAKSLHEYGTSDYPEGTFPAYGELKRQAAWVDKRPPAFSVLLALVHDLTGYRPGNVFILNSAVGFIFLLLALRAPRCAPPGRWGGFESGAWVLTLACSLPLLSLSITGAGLDLLNALLILASACLAWKVLSEDSSRWTLPWLGVSWLLFNCRYESILFVLSVAVIVLVKSLQIKRLPALGALYALPVLLVPYLLRHRVFNAYPETSLQTVDGSQAFGFSYFFNNVGHAVNYLFVPDVQGSGSVLLAWLGLVSLLILGVRMLRTLSSGGKLQPTEVVLLVYGGVVLLNLLLLLCYHWGRLDELEVSRLTLPLFLLFGVSILRVAVQLSLTRPNWVRAVLIFGVIYVFAFAFPDQSEALALKGNYHAEIDSWALEQVQREGARNAMVISSSPLFWYLHDIGSKHTDAVESRIREFEFHRRAHSMHTYLLQKIRVDPISGTETCLEGDRLNQVYASRIVAEMTYKPYHRARLSKIESPRGEFSQLLEVPAADVDFARRHPIEFWFFMIP